MSEKRERYDVIVIGSAIGGLFSASLMAKMNISVLILKEKNYETSLLKNGYRFIPFSNFSEINLNKKLIDWIFEELDISWQPFRKALSDESEIRKRISYQVLLPDNRIDVTDEALLFRIELEREFRNELDKIGDFFDEIRKIRDFLKDIKSREVPSGFFPVRRANLFVKWISSFFKRERMDKRLLRFSKEFREFIKAQLIAYGNFYPKQPSLYVSAYSLLKGLEDIDKTIDIEKLNTHIINRFYSTEGKIHEVGKIERVERKKDRFIINLDGGEKVLESRFIVINHPFKNISYFTNNESHHLLKWEKLIRPYYTIIPIFLGIKEKVVPVGMKNLLVSIFDLNKPYESGNLIYISISPTGDEFWAPRARRALVVEALIHNGGINSLDESFKRQVFSHLYNIIPFLEDYIDFVDFDWAEKQMTCWSYPYFIYGVEKSFDWRAGIIPNKLSKNLFFIGKENFPYLGLEGEIISGYLTAHNILDTIHSS